VEKKKAKKIEGLEKKIKRITKKHEKNRKIEKVASEIKNKQKRVEVVIRQKMDAKE